MALYEIKFEFFCGLMWDFKKVHIIAATRDDIKYLVEQELKDQKRTDYTWEDLKHRIVPVNLPIIQTRYYYKK